MRNAILGALGWTIKALATFLVVIIFLLVCAWAAIADWSEVIG